MTPEEALKQLAIITRQRDELAKKITKIAIVLLAIILVAIGEIIRSNMH